MKVNLHKPDLCPIGMVNGSINRHLLNIPIVILVLPVQHLFLMKINLPNTLCSLSAIFIKIFTGWVSGKLFNTWLVFVLQISLTLLLNAQNK